MAVGDAMGLGVILEAKDLFSGTMRSAGMAFKDVEGATSVAGKKITDNLKILGTGMAIFGAGLGGLALLGPAIEESMDFGKAIGLIATEVDKAVFSQDEMKKVTRGLSAEFGRMPTDEAGALYKAVAMGANTAAKATDIMTTANRLAVAGNADLAVTMDALGGTLNAYHLKASDASRVSDAMFTGMTGGNTTVGEIAASLGRVSNAAYGMGVSIEEVIGSISVMTSKNIQSSEAVSGLHAVLAGITHPSSAATAEATRLGIKFNEAAVRAQGFQGFLHSITGSAKFAADSLGKLFEGAEASNAIVTLAGDMEGVDAAMKAMTNSAGATLAGFDIMSAKLSSQEDRWAAQKKIALGYIGDVLDPMVGKFVALGNAMLEAFNTLPAGVKEWLVKGFALAATLLTIVGGAIALKGAIGVLAAGLGAAGVTLGGFLSMLAPVAAVLAVVGLAVSAFRVAWDHNLGGIATLVQGAVAKVKLAIGAFAQLFEDGGISGPIRDDLNKAENAGLKQFIKNIFLFANRLQTAWNGIATGFGSAMDAAKPSFEAFVSALGRLGEAFGFLSEGQSADDALATFGKFSSAGDSIGVALGKVAIAVVDIMTTAIALAGGVVTGLHGVGDAAKPAADAIGTIGTSISGINKELNEMDGKVSSSQSGWATLGRVIGGIVKGIVACVSASLSGLMAWFDGIANIVGGIIEILHGNISKGIQRILYGAVSGIIGIFGGIIQTFATMADKVMGIFGQDKGYGAKIAEIRAGATKSWSDSLTLTKREFAPGSEEDVLNKRQEAAEARRFLAPERLVPEAATFTPSSDPIGADAAATYAPIVAAISASNAKAAPQKAPVVNVSMALDGRELVSAMASVSRTDDDAAGVQGMVVMD